MKLYKFRALSNCEDFCKIKDIIEEGKFWCSKFMDMNDPMEGVYKSNGEDEKQITEIYNGKQSYTICSFSGEEGFKKPIVWGYYANGFKGVAIEIEIEKEKVVPINYEIREVDNTKIIDILTYKLKCWKHEDEYRFLDEKAENKVKIGNIKKIYFGNPYNNVYNEEMIKKDNKKLQEYLFKKAELETLLRSKNIPFADVTIETLKLK